jgi:beta-mannosidase
MKPKILLPLMIVLMLSAFATHGQTSDTSRLLNRMTIPLSRDWTFREVGKPMWYPAMVPGCVHTDLLANKLIDDPFWRDNEK